MCRPQSAGKLREGDRGRLGVSVNFVGQGVNIWPGKLILYEERFETILVPVFGHPAYSEGLLQRCKTPCWRLRHEAEEDVEKIREYHPYPHHCIEYRDE